MPQSDDFHVRFWGVRGTLACGGSEVSKYGGNTSCVEIRCGAHTLIFDAGTGLRYLAAELAARPDDTINLFLSHSHYDHVCGLPFFGPLFSADTVCTIWGAGHEGGLSTEAMLNRLMEAPLLPITPQVFSADISFRDIVPGETLSPVPAIEVRTAPLNHPNGATGYRIVYGGKSICYITDTEHSADGGDTAICEFIRDADIVIYDAMYTDEEYETCRGFGHSTWRAGIALCDRANAKQFVAFHHEPGHDDVFMAGMRDEIRAARPGSEVAREGMILRP